MGGLFRWNVSYVLQTKETSVSPSCGMLVDSQLVTSIDTSIESFATIVFTIK